MFANFVKFCDQFKSFEPDDSTYTKTSSDVEVRSLDYFSSRYILYIYGYGLWVKTIYVQYVNPKIAGEWMFILLELIIIGFDPPPYVHIYIHVHVYT